MTATMAASAARAEQPTTAARSRVAVLCLTYGEPPEAEFRKQYDYSLSILRRLTLRVAPIPRFILPLLAARRGRARAQGFREDGYSSPLEAITARQVEGIAARLRALRPDIDWDVRGVCEFRPPYIWEVFETMLAAPPDELVILPLYMAESDFTSGVSRTDLANFDRTFDGSNPLPEPRYLKAFGFEPRLGKVLAGFVWKHCCEAGWSEERCKNAALVLGAHGTLVYPPPDINSGAKETLYLYGMIRKHLRHRFREVRVAWLNHALGGKWTEPSADETAEFLWNRGVRDVVYFPFGFMGDNAESQIEGRDALAPYKWDNLLYLPCPNDDGAFLDVLADLTVERLDEPAESWETIEHGTEWLVNREKPARRGEPGFARFNGPTLAIFATTFWIAIAALLTTRGILAAERIESSTTLAIVGVLSLFLGIVKGQTVIARMARKNMVRLRRIPQPSPLWKMYSKPTWIVILFFSMVGMSLRLVSMPDALRSTILLAVGLSLVIGAFHCVANFRQATPIAKRPKAAQPPSLRENMRAITPEP